MNFIYNIFGLLIPVSKGAVQEIGLSYLVNGKTIFTSEDMRNKVGHGFINGFHISQINPLTDLIAPVLGVTVLGVIQHGYDRNGLSAWRETSFKGTALAGYVVSSVSYESTSVALPPQKDIEALIPKLLEDFKQKLGLKINPDNLGLHLLCK